MADRAAKRTKLGPEVIISGNDSHLTIHDVAVGGDLIVKAGGPRLGGCRTIKVHSFCLKLASPVFKAMLESPFAEGITPHTEEKPLLLPDDHGPALLEFCKILHHQASHTPDLSSFPELVLLADKYQCIRAIKSFVLMTLSPHFTSTSTIGTVEDNLGPSPKSLSLTAILCLAYVLGDAQLFHRVSAAVILNCKRAQIKRDSSLFKDLVPLELTSRIISYQVHLRLKLKEKLNEPLSDLLSGRPCEGQMKSIGHYHWQLYQKGVTKSTGWAERTLTRDWTDISEVGLMHSLPMGEEIDPKDLTCGKKCKVCPVDLWEAIFELLGNSKNEALFLCLECESATEPPTLGVECTHQFAK